jgi:hypothetical protein
MDGEVIGTTNYRLKNSLVLVLVLDPARNAAT